MLVRTPALQLPTHGARVQRFFQKHMVHSKGRWRDLPFQLLPWENEFNDDLFRIDPRTGLRVVSEALLGIGRKAGKTEYCAGLGCYLTFADKEPGAEIYSCAGDKDQASILFNVGKFMVEHSKLADLANVYKNVIEVPSTGTIWKVLSAESFTKEGLNVHAVLFDELHVQPSRELWDVMTLGEAAREQPLTLALTTAGFDLDTICGERFEYGMSVAAGEVEDPTFMMHWHGLPRDDPRDYRDPAVWRETHPGLETGVIGEAYIAKQARDKPEAIFRRYYLNQWTRVAQTWLPAGTWDACRSDRELRVGEMTFVGVDASTKYDSTAIVAAQWVDTEDDEEDAA